MTKKIILILFCSVLIFSCGKKGDPEYKETKRIERDNINLNKFQSLLKLYDRADILNDIV